MPAHAPQPRLSAERGRSSMNRSAAIASFAAAAFALAGCTSQPMAPSALSPAVPTATAAATPAASTSARGGRRASAGVVYVTGQGLYFDTFVVKDPLPMEGPFQPLGDSDGDGISETPYGPGDPGYVGGRWWVDTNGNGMQDAEDHFFLCPLLPPGRPTP
jgi:hypothetical protein